MKAERAVTEGLFNVHEALASNLKAAQVMVALEKHFREVETEEPDKEVIARSLETLPERLRAPFTGGIEKYQVLRANAARCKQIMQDAIGRYSEIPDWNVRRAAEVFNGYVFREIADTDATGNVYLSIHGPYLYISCDTDADFAKLSAAGIRDWKAIQTLNTRGCYSHIQQLKVFEMTPVAVIKLKEHMKGFAVLLVEDHEMQHFINHEIFGLFTNVEVEEDSQPMRRIKDELVAKVRSAMTNGYITKIAESDSYKYLFDDLDSFKFAEAVQAAQSLAKFMEKWGYYVEPDPFDEEDSSTSRRAELGYRLAPVKLKDWPKWLTLMDRYDEHRANMKEKRAAAH